MHAEAYEWLRSQAEDVGSVIELGSRDINGSPRPLFPNADYTGVDIREGRGVDVVADAAEWKPAKKADCVVCAEVLEHAPNAEELVKAAASWLKKGGTLLVTCACDPRGPHSAVDGRPIADGDEYYVNVDPDELVAWLEASKLTIVDKQVDSTRGDLYVKAVRD